MKIYKITVKGNAGYDCYDGFIIAANSIPEALEEMYQYVCKKLYDDPFVNIPYYLRSSNLDIKELGNFEPKDKLDEPVLMVDYTPA